jgi:predicted esterase
MEMTTRMVLFSAIHFVLAFSSFAAENKKSLDGLWLTNFGLMELKQTGDQVAGHYALGGVSSISGTATERGLDFKFKAFRKGKGTFDVAADGESFSGSAKTDGFKESFEWKGRKAPEYVPQAKLVAGKIVDGSTKKLLTYHVRAPERFKGSDQKKWPAIVILHGSNMNAKAYVSTLASSWPAIAKDYILIGINGELPSSIGKEPAFNYTYVDYVGRSTFKGFPGTDRESPALVAEAMDELREIYPIEKFFVGGHSQGGFLTYSLLMNFPEKIGGAFPISAGVIFQCEPSAYEEEKVRAAQRTVPLAIVHSEQDQVVGFDMGKYGATIFNEANWPALRFFADGSGAGHRFGLLPIDKAIRWLEAQSSDDPKKLLDFAEQGIKTKSYRDAIATLNRAGGMKLDAALKGRWDRMMKQVDAKAAAGAKPFLPKVTKGEEGKAWIDEFLKFRDDFEFAPASKEVMDAFAALRAKHEPEAKKAMNQANAAFRENKRDEGYAKYQEIVDKYYAASSYRNVKRWLAERR